MKLENCVIITKGACLTYIPFGTALSAGLPEMGVTQLLGVPVKIWQLFFAATVSGASGLLAFLSQSFGSYLAARSVAGNGTTTFTQPPATP